MSSQNADTKQVPPPGRENRRLKIAGIVLMCIGTPALGWLLDEKQRLAVFVPLFFIAGNIFVLGLILFLAGLRDIPLLTDAQARKGALVKLAGANLLLVCLGIVGLDDFGIFGKEWKETWWLVLPALVAFVLIARKGVVLLRQGWKYDAPSADRVIKEDTRPPVVYIRSFKDDDMLVLEKGLRRWLSSLSWTIAISAEQELALIMNRVGPVVAIGKPGELLPELGAARLYASDDEWRDKIIDLMKQARLVVIRAGATANLQWEIDQAVKLLPRRQLIFVSFGKGDDAEAFDKEVEQRFGSPEKVHHPPVGILLKLLGLLTLARKSPGRIIYFDEHSKPHAEDMRFAPTWSGYIMSPYRPHWDLLVVPFRQVFKQLDLPWANRKSKNIAVFLALLFGIFGVHQFYVGNRRRGLFHLASFGVAAAWVFFPFFLGGLYYLAIFCLPISMFWGWFDAIKFMRVSQQDFEQKYVHHSAPEKNLEGWNTERSGILK